MGKKGGSSWLTAVKRAFRSPTKDTSQKKSSRRREETEQDEEEEKKREKRRWLFRKPSNNASLNHEAKVTATHCGPRPPSKTPQLPPDHQSHAMAVAAATAAAAEAAVATAQAAVEIIRLTSSSNSTSSVKQNYAAIVIQTAFRGFLARRALVALKGIVKLQALIRGQNVRKQAKMTLKCMQALLRLQTRMRDHQARLSHDGGGRKSMFVETTDHLWDSRHLRDIRERKSLSKDRICIPDDWSTECPATTLEDLEAALQAKKEAALKRESSLAYAFSQQAQMKIWDSEVIGDQERTNWLDKWMATKQWDTCSRGSTDKRDSIKTVEMDISNNNYKNIPGAGRQQHSSSSSYYSASPNVVRHQKQAPSPRQRDRALHNNCSYSVSMAVQPPVTPSPSRTRPMQARPTTPRCLKEEKSYSISAANTPSLRSMQRLNSSLSRYINDGGNHNHNNNAASGANSIMPNYMAATESAKARVRSQSAPRQRASTTPERERGGGWVGAKKRLSYPAPPPDQPNNGFTSNSYGLRSPSFKSLQAAYLGMDLHSNHSFYTDSIAGEISPCSTTDLRRWLR